jgi:adenylate cyclase
VSQRGPAVLYVDDEEHNLMAFKAAFRRQFTIYTSTSGREALGILRQHHIPIVVTDQRMPDMTGVQFLEAIIPEFPDTIRMILTGFSDVDAIIKAINTGRVYRYVTKPWDEQELLMTLRGAAALAESQEKNRLLMQELQERVAAQERTVRLFQRYVPEHVVQDMLGRADEDSILDGEARIVSILMADIRGFTALSSRLPAKDVVSLLNDYFAVMTEVIAAHFGSVNKFMGDGILAVFGAPMSHLENQVNAVLAALDMVDRLQEFNARWQPRIGQPVVMGIGINTGEVVVGNIGSAARVDYTVIGDPVNVASRIEGLTHGHPNAILISQSTKDAVGGVVETKPWGPVQVKGKDEEITVHEVVGRS